MQGLETFTSGVENLGTIGSETKEFVGATEVCNFEGCTLLSNEQLASYLNETLPPSHLEGCPSIEYDPNYHEFIDDPRTLALYEGGEGGSHAIHIADETRFPGGAEGVLDTVTHDVGHNAYAVIIESNSELVAKWEELNHESGSTGLASDYAKINEYEDFAESYMTYICDSEKLQILSPEKYEFMRDYVFSGREYEPTALRDYAWNDQDGWIDGGTWHDEREYY